MSQYEQVLQTGSSDLHAINIPCYTLAIELHLPSFLSVSFGVMQA